MQRSEQGQRTFIKGRLSRSSHTVQTELSDYSCHHPERINIWELLSLPDCWPQQFVLLTEGLEDSWRGTDHQVAAGRCWILVSRQECSSDGNSRGINKVVSSKTRKMHSSVRPELKQAKIKVSTDTTKLYHTTHSEEENLMPIKLLKGPDLQIQNCRISMTQGQSREVPERTQHGGCSSSQRLEPDQCLMAMNNCM